MLGSLLAFLLVNALNLSVKGRFVIDVQGGFDASTPLLAPKKPEDLQT
jgi:hypothetical protein